MHFLHLVFEILLATNVVPNAEQESTFNLKKKKKNEYYSPRSAKREMCMTYLAILYSTNHLTLLEEMQTLVGKHITKSSSLVSKTFLRRRKKETSKVK